MSSEKIISINTVILSVKHSGTRFLQERLGVKRRIHTDSDWNSLLTAVNGCVLIAPLRNPENVWKSWCKRMVNVPRTTREALFFHSFYMLHALSQVVDIDFIAVDKKEDARITDWSPVGYEEKNNYKVPDINTRVLCMLPIINRHYL